MTGSGKIERGVHRLTLRVYYEDTDAAGIVYHANHLRFAERGRTEMLRCLGLDHTTLRSRLGLGWTVRRCVIDFLAPARLDDLLEVRTEMLRQGGASLELEQQIRRADALLVRTLVRVAVVDEAMRVARLPRELAAALAPLRALAPARHRPRPPLGA